MFEALLEAKYGYSLRDSGDGGDSEGVTEEDLSSALKICNIEWGLENERLRQYQEFILEKYRLVESYQGVNRKVNDMEFVLTESQRTMRRVSPLSARPF